MLPSTAAKKKYSRPLKIKVKIFEYLLRPFIKGTFPNLQISYFIVKQQQLDSKSHRFSFKVQKYLELSTDRLLKTELYLWSTAKTHVEPSVLSKTHLIWVRETMETHVYGFLFFSWSASPLWIRLKYLLYLSTTIGWVGTKFGTAIHDSHTMNSNDFSDPLTFYLPPSSGQILYGRIPAKRMIYTSASGILCVWC